MKKLFVVALVIAVGVTLCVWVLASHERKETQQTLRTPLSALRLAAGNGAKPLPERTRRVVKPFASTTTMGTVDQVQTPVDSPPVGQRKLAPGSPDSRPSVLKEKSGVYGYNSAAYCATFDAGSVTVALPWQIPGLGQPRLAFKLNEVRVGEQVLTEGHPLAPLLRGEDRALAFSRGAVDEQYVIEAAGVEQRFVISELPKARGALTISASLDTNLESPSESGSTLAFTANGKTIMCISDALVVDAAGRKQAVAMRVVNDVLTMTVPADWMNSATLPIVVDPLIGGPITVDGALAAYVDTIANIQVRVTDVAYDSTANEWFVVWDEQFGASAFDYDVFGQRIAANGTLAGGLIQISTGAEGDYEPSISFHPTVGQYLVVWRQDPQDNNSVTDQRIVGQVQASGGGANILGTFVVDDAPGQDCAPSVAPDNTSQWFVAFTNIVSSNDSDILGRFVTVAGPATAVSVDIESGRALAPSVAFGFGAFCIAWEKGPALASLSIVARTMDTSGTFSTGIVTVDESPQECRQADVSAGATSFLILWRFRTTPSNHDVRGRIVTPALAFVTGQFGIASGPSDQVTPRCAYAATTNEWLVAYPDMQSGNGDIYAARVTASGSISSTTQVTANGITDRRPELAWSSASNEMLIAHLFGSSAPFEIHAQRFSMDFIAPTVDMPIGMPNPNNTGSHAVSWTANDTGGSGIASYEVQRSFNAGAFAAILTTSSTSFAESNLPEGSYVYRVRATDNAGNQGVFSPDSAPVTVDKTAPSNPGTLGQFKSDATTPIAVGGSTNETTVVLKGVVSDSATAVKLEVEVKAVGVIFDGTGTLSSAFLPDGTTASVTASALGNDTAYHWRARAVDAAGNAGTWSPFGGNDEGSADFIVGNVAIPPAPVITTTSHKTKSPTPTVVGTSVPNVTISIYVNNQLDGTTSSSGSWTYPLMPKPEGMYIVTARASNAAGQSPDSNSITLIVDLTAPSPPTQVHTTTYKDCVHVEWLASASSDVAGYNVYRKEGTGSWVLLNTVALVTGTKYSDESVATGSVYAYRVTAVDDALQD